MALPHRSVNIFFNFFFRSRFSRRPEPCGFMMHSLNAFMRSGETLMWRPCVFERTSRRSERQLLQSFASTVKLFLKLFSAICSARRNRSLWSIPKYTREMEELVMWKNCPCRCREGGFKQISDARQQGFWIIPAFNRNIPNKLGLKHLGLSGQNQRLSPAFLHYAEIRILHPLLVSISP